jgi:serine/threonine protein kinase/Tol biopolymer transport system component
MISMPLSAGTRIGHYEVIASLGAGGMGEVFRARDTKLNRDVALKVLPEVFAADPDRLARFKREAQLLASLNHPHIAAIYGFEDSGSVHALVLELVDGPTLSNRIAEGAIPINTALAIARQIIDALEAAHEQGIIHRDLKPANIKVRSDGTVKVLDFGLAKALESDSARRSDEPTITSRSVEGGIAGTPAYMSPEQARGEAVDKRTDIWAFGCVLFEMLTGARAFAGQSTTDTIAAIIRADPEWSRLPRDTPDSVRRTLRRCLEKDRKRRLADIRDARLDIEDADSPQPATRSVSRRSIWAERIAWSTALAAVLIAGGAAWRTRTMSAGTAGEMRVEIAVPPTTAPVSLALSPDGKKLVFVASSDGNSQLWLRSLETGALRALRGTDGAAYPFWSPDSRSVAFFTVEKLYRMAIDGGAPQIVASAPVGSGGTWSSKGVILFPPVPDAPLMRVSESGGQPSPVGAPADGQRTNKTSSTFEGGQRFPQFLPDGRHYLYYVRESRTVFLGDLDRHPAKRLFEADAAAVVAPPDRVLFVRDGKLFSQRIDPARLEMTDGPAVVAEGVSVDSRGVPAVSASADGSIVYRTGSVDQRRTLVWFDRSGKELGAAAEPDDRAPVNVQLSPDQRSAVLSRSYEGNTDVWILDVNRKAFTRVTTDPAPELVPTWSPDGGSILYSKVSGGGFRLAHKPLREGGKETELPITTRAIALDWSSDNRFILYRTNEPAETGWNVWAIPDAGSGKPFPLLQSHFDERTATFSPDARWIAYESNETGQFEIYIYPFPGPGEKVTVSNRGGSQPRWKADGTELFYVAADGNLMSVPVRLPSASQRIELGTPTALFRTRIGNTVQGGIAYAYAITKDGQRFLMSTLVEQPAVALTLILNRREAK